MASFTDAHECEREYSFVDDPPDRVICKICHNPCREAHLTKCCGAHFCYSCLQQLKKGTAVNKACPVCREEKFKIFPNKQVDREIKELHVYCINRNMGCTWAGEMNDMDKHINTDCLFVNVYCPSKCGVTMERQCLSQHLSNECSCHCQYCGVTGCKEDISRKHKKHCPQFPLPCPNGCEMGVVPGTGVAEHKKVCPLELVQCNYCDIGCKSLQITRRELKDHYQENVLKHLDLIKSRLTNIVESMDKTEKMLVMTEQHLDKFVENTKRSCDGLKIEMKTVEDHVKANTKALHTKKPYIPDIDAGVEDKNSLFEARLARLFMIMFLCFIVYIVDIKGRLQQTEEYTWPKILNRMAADSEKSPVVPGTFKIPDYAEKLENNETWTSPSAVFKHGYKTWLSVKLVKGEGMAVSFYFQRAHSYTWNWPQNEMFTLELLNQQYDSNHYFTPFLIGVGNCYYVNDATIRYTTGLMSATLLDQTSQYFKNGNAYLRVSHGKSIYAYIDWYMRQYLNRTLSNYPFRILTLLIISMLLILEFQAVLTEQLKKFAYFNETFLRIFEVLSMYILLYILLSLFISYLM